VVTNGIRCLLGLGRVRGTLQSEGDNQAASTRTISLSLIAVMRSTA
jgi:hypothetical protein